MLVTGPTGSGKTTTLYSALELLRTPEKNIITIEDPVEYQLDLINQIHVHDSIGLTFARCLRSILRQDPDVIMVGEIRDDETARVAVQAALTGHMVLATLHTNDVPVPSPGCWICTLSRICFPARSLVSWRSGCAKDLRKLAIKYYPEEHVLRDAGLTDKGGRPFRKGAGCTRCHDSGYSGRVGIYEVMEVTPVLRPMIHRAAASHEMCEAP